MASMRDIRRRIKSVGSTKQITKAMNLISASKLTKAKVNLEQTHPFFNETRRVIASIVNTSKGNKHKYLVERDVQNTAIIVIAGDRGLCGGYNTNICKEAHKLAKEKNSVSMITIGTKSRDYFRRRNVNIAKQYYGIYEKPFYHDASDIGSYILEGYSNNQFDEVYLAYTEFISTISQKPKLIRVLPVDTSDFENNDDDKKTKMNYEPDEESVLDYIIPKYINTVIYGALVESAACEQGARMTAMDSASENADEMIDSLTLKYNRVRQGAITQEITEIVGGANAL